MYQNLQRFVTTFRNLEQKDQMPSEEDRIRLLELKEKLGTTVVHESTEILPQAHRVIAVASFYPQAGATFLASNYAFVQSQQGRNVTLCEWPQMTSYLYFALDGEKRGVKNGYQADVIKLGSLKIYMKPPAITMAPMTSHDIMAWFFAHGKHASLLIIDLSSNWADEGANAVLEWADEVWLVLDNDLPRLARQLLTVPSPKIWDHPQQRVHVIANRWTPALTKGHVMKRIEATLSMWGQGQSKRKIKATLPVFEPDHISQAMLAGKLFTEFYPEERRPFEQLAFL